MISLNASPTLFGIYLLVGLEGVILSLIALWMLRQQKFLHSLSLSLRDLERYNREAQRDLLLILRSNLGFQEIPPGGQSDGVSHEYPSFPRQKASETDNETNRLSLEEVRLLVALSGEKQLDRQSLASNLKNLEGFNNLEAKLKSLRDKGYIFYSDVSDVLAILPKGLHYLGPF